MESKEFRETDEVHNYLKEIRISVDKNIQFCHLKRFKSDTIKLAAQESGKKLQSNRYAALRTTKDEEEEASSAGWSAILSFFKDPFTYLTNDL